MFFGVRVLVASADVNLKRQMIIPEAEKNNVVLFPEVLISHQTHFFFELSNKTKRSWGWGGEGSQKPTPNPQTKNTTAPLSRNLTN